jgi:cell division protease FtsH
MNNNKKNTKDKKIAEFRFNFNIKTVFIILFIGIFFLYLYNTVSKEVQKVVPEKSISTIIQNIRDNKVEKLDIIENKILVYYKDKSLAVTYKEPNSSFLDTLQTAKINPNNVQINVKDTTGSAGMVNFLSNLIPTILMVAFFIFLFRQAKGAQESVFSFGQSRAKRFSKDTSKITFNDVAGVDEAKKEPGVQDSFRP